MMTREPDFVDECYAGKDLSLLKKLTLVIPTYNRNYYLSRCLWYHAHFPFGEIIVADSSPEEKKVVNRESISNVRRMFGSNILYLEYEPETDKYGGDIYRKWGDAVQHANTEYTLICTDKEFVVPKELLHIIYFLDENIEYSTADGVCGYISLTNNNIKYSHLFSLNSLDSDVISERLSKYNEYKTYTLLAIHRSEIIKKEYDDLNKYNLNDLRFGEIALELQDIIYGKYNVMNSVSKCRDTIQFEKKFNKCESSTSRYPRIQLYDEDRYQKLYDSLCKCLESIIDLVSKIPNEDKKSINENLNKYLIERFSPSFGIFKKYPKLYYLWDIIPNIISSHIRSILYNPVVKDKIHENNELKIISKIILETSNSYTNDAKINYLSCSINQKNSN